MKVIARRSKMSFTLLQNEQIGSFYLFFCRSLSCLKLCLLLLVLGSLVHVTVWLMHRENGTLLLVFDAAELEEQGTVLTN